MLATLDQIIVTQVDSRGQQGCIYKLSAEVQDSSQGSEYVERYYEVRVKSLVYDEQEAIAIFLYD